MRGVNRVHIEVEVRNEKVRPRLECKRLVAGEIKIACRVDHEVQLITALQLKPSRVNRFEAVAHDDVSDFNAGPSLARSHRALNRRRRRREEDVSKTKWRRRGVYCALETDDNAVGWPNARLSGCFLGQAHGEPHDHAYACA